MALSIGCPNVWVPERPFKPELSAQRLSHPPSPLLGVAISYLLKGRRTSHLGRVADIGAGKLRHARLLHRQARRLYLVDTEQQLRAVHRDGSRTYTMETFVAAMRAGNRVRALSSVLFAGTRLRIDVAFCVAVMDVVPQFVRRQILTAAIRNLRQGGDLVLIVPRNDSTILRRCHRTNRRWDGHWFLNRNGFTFFRNFRSVTPLVRMAEMLGVRLLVDLSVYRQVCLIFKKERTRE